MKKDKAKVERSKFPRLYWVVIIFEFFERGSYYGMMSILSVYFTDQLLFSKESVGVIKGVIQPLLYFLPILSGAIADRFGYRRVLMFAFALLGGGYFLTSQMETYTAVFLSLAIMGIGAGTFKPIISGTIARCTDETNSTLGFGIFYWTINLGAFLFPLILVPYLKNNIGWEWVIIASAIGTGSMLIPTILIFKEPPKPKDEGKKEKKHNLIKTLANAFEIIYSPFVLVFQYFKTSTGKVVVLILIAAGLISYSIYEYSQRDEVSERITERLYQVDKGFVEVDINRNVLRDKDFKVKELIRKEIGEDTFILSCMEEDKKVNYLIEDNGKDLIVSVYKTKTYDSFKVELLKDINEKLGSEKLSQEFLDDYVKNRENVNQLQVTIYDPDKYFSTEEGKSYEDELYTKLIAHSNFTGLNKASLNNMVKEALEKVWLEVYTDGDNPKDKPYEVEVVKDKDINDLYRVKAEVFKPAAYSNFKEKMLSEVRQHKNLGSITQSRLDNLFEKSKKRPFFVFYLSLLFIFSIAILTIERKFKNANRQNKLLFIFATLVVMCSILWMLPDLSVFSRIITTVIMLSSLSLYLIDFDEVERFKDHFKFLLMIFLYAGFWILYFQMFDSVLWYVQAYVNADSVSNFVNSAVGVFGIDLGWKFDVEHVTVINAGTIILLQLIISRIVEKTKALPTMIFGILLGTCGMAMLAISTSIWVFMAGIIIFSIGEMTAHPKFISYIGQTAPKARVAMYMGYLFLYGVIGSSIGGVVGAQLYVQFVDNLNQPRTLWLIFTGIGVLTIVSLLLYNKFLVPKEDKEKVT